jgi:tetratricopeptide (TPR) repeat protein
VSEAQGKPADAERFSLRALEEEPWRYDVFCLRGYALLQLDRASEALTCFDRTLGLKAEHASALAGRGLALIKLGKINDALSSIERALALDPRDPQALFARGTARVEADQPREALADLEAAIEADPHHARAFRTFGRALELLGRYREALTQFETATTLAPGLLQARIDRARVLAKLDRPHEARLAREAAIDIHPPVSLDLANDLNLLGQRTDASACVQRAVSLQPDDTRLRLNLGILRLLEGAPLLAADELRRCTQLDPNMVEAHRWLSKAHFHAGDPVGARQALARALELGPRDANAWAEHGLWLFEQGHIDEALESFDRALDPGKSFGGLATQNRALTVARRAKALFEMGRREEALREFNRAEEIHFDHEYRQWEGECRLAMGDFENGWVNHAFIYGDMRSRPAPTMAAIQGQTILLIDSFGYGDTIMLARYATAMAREGARVLLAAPRPLMSLLASVPGVEGVFPREEPQPSCDRLMYLWRTPLLFPRRVSAIPAGVPYVKADKALIADWAAQLGPKAAPRVGLIWAGSPAMLGIDAFRSVPSALLEPLLELNADFVSLQPHLRPGDAQWLAKHPTVRHFGGRLRDFSDTAAVLECLDLLITVDTSTLHLAGALGKPVWVLARMFPTEWRWMFDREDSPWYPTLRLFRQSAIGNWEDVFARVRVELRRFLDERANLSGASVAG